MNIEFSDLIAEVLDVGNADQAQAESAEYRLLFLRKSAEFDTMVQ